MKVGIIVHSFTGHTYAVGEVIRDELSKSNMQVELKKLDIIGGEERDEININRILFSENIDPNDYDALVVGGPVRGFYISPALKAYLSRAQGLNSKPVYIFVTHYFPFKSMGGTSAIKQIKIICDAKQANLIGTGIIDWKNGRREEQIKDLAISIKDALKAL